MSTAGPRAQAVDAITTARCENPSCLVAYYGPPATARAREHARTSGHRIVVERQSRTVYDGSTP